MYWNSSRTHMQYAERKGGTNKNGVCKTNVHVAKGTEKAMTDRPGHCEG